MNINMNIINVLILGLIQGIAEALPISSSAHLLLYKHFANAKNVPIFFDVLLHIATLLAVMLVFRKKIAEFTVSLFRFTLRRSTENDKRCLSHIAIILLASLITAIVGFALKDLVKNLNAKAIPIGFCMTASFLLVSQKTRLKKTPNILRTAAILGIAQGLAVFPGISRLGMTVSTLLMLGFAREEVTEFSFILSIPAVLGAALLEGLSAIKSGASLAIDTFTLSCGMLVAFLFCLVTLNLFLRVIRSGRLACFAFYLFPLAILLQAYFVFWSI